MSSIKTVIIEDEWLIRSELKSMLAHYPIIDIVGEATTIAEAVKLCTELKPDLVFLDIQLAGGSGFDFLSQVNRSFKLVFITAFDQYLPKARKYQPLDYLLKPISKEKLLQVVRKL